MFSPQQIQRGRGLNRFCLEAGGGGGIGEVAQTMYTHLSKCKNDKIKERKKEYNLEFAHIISNHNMAMQSKPEKISPLFLASVSQLDVKNSINLAQELVNYTHGSNLSIA
jgi:hypothetical protein